MGEQIKAEDWLPEGWKVEIRVRESGKKDRYYIDPTNGYIFRSLKDIDRYLLTGKLGRHVTKTKPKDLDISFVKQDIKTLPDMSKKKESLMSNRMKKSCPDVQEQKSSARASNKENMQAENSKEMAKKKISRPSRKTTKTSRKREASPFFILDPDQCDEVSAANIPNLSEIIDSMLKEEGHNTVYISAPAIGALLGGQLPQTRVELDNNEQRPQFSQTRHECYYSYLPSMALNFHAKNEGNEFKIKSPSLDPSGDLNKTSNVIVNETESKDNEELGISPLFGDLLTDPCIDFAIKTLTGAIPLGSEPATEDCYFQGHIDSPTVLREGSSCQN